jgi:hypothetical protein
MEKCMRIGDLCDEEVWLLRKLCSYRSRSRTGDDAATLEGSSEMEVTVCRDLHLYDFGQRHLITVSYHSQVPICARSGYV